jgi:hypothetical protein
MWVLSFYFMNAMAQDLIEHLASVAYNGILEAVWLGLYTAPTSPPTPATLMSGITEATFDGYARVPLVWRPPYLDQLGPQNIVSSGAFFQPTDNLNPNTITGCFIADALIGGHLLMSSPLSPPIALVDAQHAAAISAKFQLAFTNNYGGPVVND